MGVTRPRGPLPSRVYWARRLLVLGVAVALAFGLAQLLGMQPADTAGPSPRPASAGVAQPSASGTPPDPATPSVPAPSQPPTAGATQQRASTPLPSPTGPCEDGDVRVEPAVVEPAYAAQEVTLRLKLTTVESPACTWEVSPASVVVRVTSGTDRIWTTQECTSAVPREPVVVRRDTAVAVDLTWSGQRSDQTCSEYTDWSRPGWYHVMAAAYGGEPTQAQFELGMKPRETVTPRPQKNKQRTRVGGAGA